MTTQAVPSNFSAETAENLEDIEKQFAVKAVEQAETYWNILTKVPPSALKLTKLDDEIHASFTATFPELKGDALRTLNEDQMKSKEGKEKWRNWINLWEKKVDDYNFGTLLRTDARGEYEQDNTIFSTRMQFYAIEIARNRAGLNDEVYQKNKSS